MLRYIGPPGASKPRELKVDIATDEYVETVEQLSIRPVWDDLPESIPFDVYPLARSSGELRCVIQRLQCRDLFDLFQLVDALGVDLVQVRLLFERKAQAKKPRSSVFRQRFEDGCLITSAAGLAR